MRHLVSIVLGIVLSPLIYVIAGFSAVKLGEANAGTVDIVPAVFGLAAAFVAGALYAILIMARLSPLGPVLAGLLYLGVTLWALLDLDGFRTTMPDSVLGTNGVLHAPAEFGTALLAVPLLITIFSPRRWRRTAQPLATYGAAPTYPTSTVSAAPAYYDPPNYDPPTLASSYTPPLYTPSTYTPPTHTPSTPIPSAPTPSTYPSTEPTTAQQPTTPPSS